MAIGLDVGTYNIIKTVLEGGKPVSTKEVNAFFVVPLENQFLLNMMRQTGVPMVERDNEAYIIGQSAIDLAVSMAKEVNRPMANGVLSVKEKEAFDILGVIIRSMIGEVEKDGEVVAYSVPADAINVETNASYHKKVVEAILKSYNVNGKSITPVGVNEAFAIIMAELTHQQRTGIGISFGAGCVNVCAAVFSVPVFEFSLVGSGDKIDEQAAMATGEPIPYINKKKLELDLGSEPTDSVSRALVYNYRILIEHVVDGIIKGIDEAGSKAAPGKPMDIVVAGGTAQPPGFIDFFKKVLSEKKMPIEIGDVKLSTAPLYSVSIGCLMAALAVEDVQVQVPVPGENETWDDVYDESRS